MSIPRRRRRINALASSLLSAALAAGLVSGCAPAPDLDAAAAGALQSQVLAVTESAAADDAAGALKRLDELVGRLDAAAADGKVSFQRHQSIKTSAEAVRADLTARVGQQQAAAAAAKAAADQAAADKAAADKAAADQAAAAQAAADKAAADQAAAQAAAQQSAAQQAPPPAPSRPSENGKAKGKNKGGD